MLKVGSAVAFMRNKDDEDTGQASGALSELDWCLESRIAIITRKYHIRYIRRAIPGNQRSVGNSLSREQPNRDLHTNVPPSINDFRHVGRMCHFSNSVSNGRRPRNREFL